ncbi:hypothetical protein [Candidatus Ichthyocystis sparus]|nr:hypothetical protein [Candidatus Ichthyocystis sparus]
MPSLPPPAGESSMSMRGGRGEASSHRGSDRRGSGCKSKRNE